MAKADPNQPCIDLNENDGSRLFETRNFNLVVDCDFGDIEDFNSFGTPPISGSERRDHPNENDLPASIGRVKINGARHDLFKVEPLTDGVYGPQHRRGSNGSEPGVRDDAWYNKKYDKVVQLESDNLGSYLVQRGREITQSSQDNEYTDVPPERDFNLCTSWLDTFSIIASEAGKIPNPATPNVTFGKRTFFEILVNFDEVKTPGFRHSWWLMPATNNTPDRGAVVINDSGSFLDNTAYDGRVNAKNGVEIDIYEYEHIPSFEQTLLMKAIPNLNLQENTQNNYSPPSFNTDTNTLVRARGLQPGDLNDITYNDVNRGWVRIGFLWDDSEMIWLINGNPVVKDNLLMPNEARMYMLLTREISDVISGGTVDPTSAENRQLLANDRVKIRYIRVWEVNYQNPPRTMDNNPRQPGQVRGFPLSNTTVRLKWNASENAEKYNLYRDDAYITTVFGTQFDDSNLSPDTAYRYEVEALRDGRPASVRSCVAIVNTW